MPKASVVIPHLLGQVEAATRLRQFIDSLREQYGDKLGQFDQRMDGRTGAFSFTVQGVQIKAALEIKDAEVAVECDLPLVAAMFKGRVESELRDRLSHVLQ